MTVIKKDRDILARALWGEIKPYIKDCCRTIAPLWKEQLWAVTNFEM